MHNTAPLGSCCCKNSVGPGTSAAPCLNKLMPEPCKDCSSCAQYLLSFHNPASCAVTNNVPADPSKPLIQARLCQCSGKYSDKCGSELNTKYASIWWALITVRNARRRA